MRRPRAAFASAASTIRSTCRCARRPTRRCSATSRTGRTRRPGTTRSAPRRSGWTAASPSTSPPSTRTSRTCRRPRPPAPAPRAWCSTCRPPAAWAAEAELFARPNANWDFGVSASVHRCEAHLLGHLDAAGRHVGGGRRPCRWQPAADGAQDPGGRERGLHAAGHGRQGFLRQPDGAIRGLVPSRSSRTRSPGSGRSAAPGTRTRRG